MAKPVRSLVSWRTARHTPAPKERSPAPQKRAGTRQRGQQRKIWALMYKLQAASPSKAPIGDRLCAIIKKELGIDAVPKNPFAWIDYKGGNKPGGSFEGI